MNWDQLLSSMDAEAFKNLSLSVSREENKRAEESAKNLPELTEEEFSLACNGGKIRAIQSYHNRIGCSLREAKCVVDNCLKSPPKNYMDYYPRF